MKLTRFIGKNVRGYMQYDIHFRDSLTFLIGINGSGKTSVLNLISGLITPDYNILNTIKYDSIELEFISDEKKILISSIKNEKDFTLAIKENGEKIKSKKFKIINNLNEDQQLMFDETDDESNARAIIDFQNSDIAEYIANFKTPLFLGLNRRIIISNPHIKNLSKQRIEREMFLRRRNAERNIKIENIDQALYDIQQMLFDNIRENARRQSFLSESFRKDVLKESLTFSEALPIFKMHDFEKEIKKLDERKSTLDSVVDNLEISSLKNMFDLYFDSLKNVLLKLKDVKIKKNEETIDSEYNKNLLILMINMLQLDKIDKIINFGKRYNDQINQLKSLQTRLTDSLNMFFKEGRKIVEINGRGEICVKLPGGKTNTIFELSSGEKQLIIMFAHLAFYSNANDTNIFVIDEPELSLHLTWQEIFVKALLTASPSTQFILATHAPSIISKIEWQSNCEDLTQKV